MCQGYSRFQGLICGSIFQGNFQKYAPAPATEQTATFHERTFSPTEGKMKNIQVVRREGPYYYLLLPIITYYLLIISYYLPLQKNSNGRV